MERIKLGWKKTPRTVRRPLVLVVGTLFILASGLVGWLPGPGGIPIFLIGIAILSSEFEQAARLRDWILKLVYGFGAWYRQHRIVGTLLILLCCCIAIATSVTLYTYVFNRASH